MNNENKEVIISKHGSKIIKDNFGKERYVNEDIIVKGENYIILMDGSSGLEKGERKKEIQIDNERTNPEWYVKKVSDFLKKGLEENLKIDIKELLLNALKYIKEEIKKVEAEKEIKFEKYEIPSATLSIVRQYDEKIEIVSLGDSTIAVEKNDGTIDIYEDEKIQELDNNVLEEMLKIASKKKIHVKEARKETKINELIIKNRMKKNTKDGYWILDIDFETLEHLKIGNYDSSEISKIVLHSDGMDYKLLEYNNHKEFIKDLNYENVIEKCKEIRKQQDIDKDCDKYPRISEKDDLTVGFFYPKMNKN